MTKIIHTADTHLGYTQYYSPEREQDFLDAFTQVVDIAIEEEADAVVHGGDGFHSSRPDFSALSGAMEQLNRLDQHKIQFLTVLGNHDSGGKSKWLDLFEIVERAQHLTYEPTYVDDVAIYGIDHMSDAQRQYTDITFTPASSKQNLLVAHGEFYPFIPGGWDLDELLSQSNVDFDAVLLGDQHEYMFETVNGVPATYPGSTERTAHDQVTDRRVNVVTIENGDVDIETRKLETRNFVVKELTLGPSDTTDAVVNTISQFDIDGSVVHINLVGEGEYIDIQNVERRLKETYNALYVSVSDDRERLHNQNAVSVDFSDPTDVIDENVSDLNLSSIGQTLDTVVRESDVAKTRIKDNVDETVSDAIDDVPDQFLPSDDNRGAIDEYRSMVLEVATYSWAKDLFDLIKNEQTIDVADFSASFDADEDEVRSALDRLHEWNVVEKELVTSGLDVEMRYKPTGFLVEPEEIIVGQ